MEHHCPHLATQFQALLGIFWWSSGISRQSIHTLERRGLSISCEFINHILPELSPKRLAEAQLVARSPYLTTYDNINTSISSLYEQREDVVQSGAIAVLYRLRNANPDHTSFQELLKRDREGRDPASPTGEYQTSALRIIGTLARRVPKFTIVNPIQTFSTSDAGSSPKVTRPRKSCYGCLPLRRTQSREHRCPSQRLRGLRQPHRPMYQRSVD